jgi:hypothetical protein
MPYCEPNRRARDRIVDLEVMRLELRRTICRPQLRGGPRAIAPLPDEGGSPPPRRAA